MIDAPRLFVSYSWTSDTHREWVISLASQLRESGVDVILDAWDLREGQDANSFMEKMVTDKSITKVVMVCDRLYSEKADKRAGGVGTESQIISPEIYGKTDQTKFVAVVREYDADRKPYVPTFFKSRIYIDFSTEDSYAASLDQLLRWIFDKPVHVKPPLGKPPAFLDATKAIPIPTQVRARRAVEALRSGSATALGALDEYLNALSDGMQTFRLNVELDKQPDELLLPNLEAFLPYRNEFIEVMSACARFWRPEFLDSIHAFLERALKLHFRPQDAAQWTNYSADNFKFSVQELFLYVVALLVRFSRFDAVSALLAQRFYLGDLEQRGDRPMVGYSEFRKDVPTFDVRKRRLGLKRLSLHSDFLFDRIASSGLPPQQILQADFILFMREAVQAARTDAYPDWWPDTLLYSHVVHGPFEIFARSESSKYFEQVRPILDLRSKVELDQLIPQFGHHNNSRIYIPRWEHTSVPITQLLGHSKLCSLP